MINESSGRRTLRAWAGVAVTVAALAGCASTNAVYDSSVAELEDLRSAIRGVGVHQTGFAETELATPAKGALGGARRGAVYGAVLPVVVGLVTPVPFGVLFGLALSPLGALSGALYGAVVAPPRERVEAAEYRLHPAVEEGRTLSDLLEFEVVRQGREKTSLVFVSLSEYPYSELTVDYVLEIVPLRIGLRAPSGIQPDSTSFLEVRATLRKRGSDEPLLEEKFSCEGVIERSFFDWSEDDGLRLAVEYARFPEQIAEKIIDDFFLVCPTRP